VKGDNLHFETQAADLRHATTDAPAANHAQDSIANFGAKAIGARKVIGLHKAAAGNDALGNRHEQRDSMFGCGFGRGVGGVDDHNTALSGSGEVNVINADTGTDDGAQAGANAIHKSTVGVDN